MPRHRINISLTSNKQALKFRYIAFYLLPSTTQTREARSVTLKVPFKSQRGFWYASSLSQVPEPSGNKRSNSNNVRMTMMSHIDK